MFGGSGETAFICGASGSGKTRLAIEIIKTFIKNFQSITILTGSSYSHDWDELVGVKPEKMSIDALNNFIRVTELQAMTGRKGKFLLICDDFIGALGSTKTNPFKLFATQGRHLGITVIFLVQSLTFLDPMIRGNTSEIFLMAKQPPVSLTRLDGILNIPRGRFNARYAELEKYDFVHISNTTGETIFSRRVGKDGFKHRKIPSRDELLSRRIREETAMHMAIEEQSQMRYERAERDSALQASYPEDNRTPTISSSSSSSSSSAEPSIQFPPGFSSPPATREPSTYTFPVPAQPRTDEGKSESEQLPRRGVFGVIRKGDASGSIPVPQTSGGIPGGAPRSTSTAVRSSVL